MKLSLGKRNGNRPAHVVLTCNAEEFGDVMSLVHSTIAPGRRIPVERHRTKDEIKMRFHISFLERIMLCLPLVEVSPGIEKKLFASELERLIAMPVPDLDIPEFKGELWEHQRVAAKWLADEEGELLNDDMGAGKTLSILSAIVMKNWFPALIVVGSVSAKWVWSRHLDQFFPSVSYTVVDGSAETRKRQIREDTQIKIVNAQGLRIKRELNKTTNEIETVYCANPDLFEIPWEVFVCDEYHRFKNPGAQQTAGFIAMECGRFIGASGTPIMNRPEEAWSFIHKCDPEFAPTYYHFEQSIGQYTPAGKLIGYDPEEMTRVKNWLAKHSLRRRKEHIAAILEHHGHEEAKLPKVIYSEQIVPMTPEQRNIYNKIRKEMVLLLDDGSSKKIPQALAQILRLKQAALSPELFGGSKKSGKIDQIKEDVAEIVSAGEKAIIFSEWSTSAQILKRELAEYNPAYVDGSVKGKNRQYEEDRFNNDPDCKLYIGTIRANQEAITLSAATYVLFADEEWSPQANKQAEDRSASGGLRGLGIMVPVNIIRYYAEDTIEQRLAHTLKKKNAVFRAFTERDAGRVVRSSIINTIRDLL